MSAELVPIAPAATLAVRQVDLIEAFLAGRNPRTLLAYGRDLEDFARFAGAGDRKAAVEALLSAGQGGANA